MTKLLYYEDAYLREASAKVLSVIQNEDQTFVELDQTIFYPGGGGEKPDRGLLSWEDAEGSHELSVLTAKKDGDRILHRVQGSYLPPEGQSVRMILDWERRYSMMRVHTSLHLLSAVIYKTYGVLITGGDIKEGTGRLDFDFQHSLDAETRAEIEAKVQQLIDQDLKVTSRWISREEAEQIPDLIRLKVNLLPPNLTRIRVVEIEGADLQADGGLHVKTTKEIGTFKIVKSKNKGKGRKRLEIAVLP